MNSGRNSAINIEKQSADIKPVLAYIFAQCEGDSRPYLEVSIFDVKFSGLLDSGASVSLMNLRSYNILREYGIELLSSPVKSCTVANNSSCSIVGLSLIHI